MNRYRKKIYFSIPYLLFLLFFLSVSLQTIHAVPQEKNQRSYIFMPLGFNLSTSQGMHGNDHTFQWGGDLSLVNFSQPSFVWWGGFVDFMHMPHYKELSINVGPQIGAGVYGIDLAYSLHKWKGEYDHGISSRFSLSFVVVHPYVRTSYLFDKGWQWEFGATFKFPFLL